MDRLPQFGEWLLSNNLWDPDPPFAVLRVNFNSMSGTARHLQHTVPLTRFALVSKNKFGAHYEIGQHKGLLEATYNDDQTLSIKFIGNPHTTCTARPTELVGGERPIAQWSTTEKLREAINRSLPKLPAHVAHEIKAMLTPQALAIMAGALALWGVSHFFAVGEIADAIMLVGGGLLMGTVAADVGAHLGKFGGLVVRARTDADLDAAADHFAQAVSKGGVQVVLAILLYKGAKTLPKRAGPPVRAGELPTDLNAVPEAEIPPRSRASAAERASTIGRALSKTEEAIQEVRLDPRVDRKLGWSCDDAAALLEEKLPGGETVPASVGEHVVYVYPKQGPNQVFIDATAVQFTSRNAHPLPWGVKSRLPWSQLVEAHLDGCVESGIFTHTQYELFLKLVNAWKG